MPSCGAPAQAAAGQRGHPAATLALGAGSHWWELQVAAARDGQPNTVQVRAAAGCCWGGAGRQEPYLKGCANRCSTAGFSSTLPQPLPAGSQPCPPATLPACQRSTARRLSTLPRPLLAPPPRQLLTSTPPHPTYAPLPLPACCSSLLEKCEAADAIALRHVERPALAQLGIEPLIEDAMWEARCRVQVRAVLLRRAELFCAVLCNAASPCCAVLCHAMPCCAALGCAGLGRTLLAVACARLVSALLCPMLWTNGCPVHSHCAWLSAVRHARGPQPNPLLPAPTAVCLDLQA